MTQNIIEKKYSQRLKEMTPERKLKIATELENLILDIAREGIKNKEQNSDERFIKQELKKRIELKEELEKLWTRKKRLQK